MSFDVSVEVTGLPGLQVEIDLEARLVLGDLVRDLDDDSSVAVDAGLTVGAPQELE
jgi:hypothetical protein